MLSLLIRISILCLGTARLIWPESDHKDLANSEGSLHAVPRQPNIVFILMDDLGWADIGVNGSMFYQTPHIDKLAAQGMNFTNGYAACPVCSPTRAALMTGKYPARLQITDWLPGRPDMTSQKMLRASLKQQLPLAEKTIAEALKERGYSTAHIGKWHLGGKGFGPEEQGFDLNIGGNNAGSPASYFYPYVQKDNPAVKIPGLDKGIEGEYLTDRLTTEVENFIERNQDKPFFIYLSHYAVHIPLKGKQELIEKYEKKATKGSTQDNPVYAAMIESMDQSVGRILKKLDECKLRENTIVVFTGDNGGLHVKEGPNTPATSNTPLREGKGYLYEGGIREPLIIRWPGVTKPGTVSQVPVSTIDFYPTFLAVTGGVDNQHDVDGVNILPVLKGASTLARKEMYWHYPHYSNQGGKPGAAIRQNNFKLIEFYEDGKVELYDLNQDRGEKKNLAAGMPEKVKELQKKLAQWRQSVNARMMTPNPGYDASVPWKEGKIITNE